MTETMPTIAAVAANAPASAPVLALTGEPDSKAHH